MKHLLKPFLYWLLDWMQKDTRFITYDTFKKYKLFLEDLYPSVTNNKGA